MTKFERLDTKTELKETPLVSVVVPVYMVEDYLDACVESIICQTYENLEILLVVQPSGDRSAEIAGEWAKKDNRIRIYEESWADLANARNLGITATSGDYICYVDSDDLVHPRFVELFLRTMAVTGSDIVECLVYSFLDQSRIPDNVQDYPSAEVHSGREFAKHQLLGTYGSPSTVVQTKMYKRKVFDGVRFPAGRVCEDTATTYRTYWNAEKVAVLLAETYYYRSKRTDSITHSASAKPRVLFDVLEARVEQLRFYERNAPDIADLARYLICNDITRIRAQLSKSQIESNENCVDCLKHYKGWVRQVTRSSVTKSNKLLVVLGYLCPKLWLKIWEMRNERRHSKEWKNKK